MKTFLCHFSYTNTYNSLTTMDCVVTGVKSENEALKLLEAEYPQRTKYWKFKEINLTKKKIYFIDQYLEH